MKGKTIPINSALRHVAVRFLKEVRRRGFPVSDGFYYLPEEFSISFFVDPPNGKKYGAVWPVEYMIPDNFADGYQVLVKNGITPGNRLASEPPPARGPFFAPLEDFRDGGPFEGWL